MRQIETAKVPSRLKLLVLIPVGIIVLSILLSSVVIVPAGHRGVLMKWGAVVQMPLDEGLHFITPIYEKVESMDVRTQKYQYDADSASKDLQSVISTIAVNYHIDPSQVSVIYQTIGKEYQDRVIAPAIEESVKASTARYTSEELITKREDAKSDIKEEVEGRLQQYHMIVETVSIVNFKFSPQFDAAIESKVTAEQNALTAQRKLEQIKFEADQKRAEAQGEADAKLAVATAEAKSIEIQGEALRKNPEVIQLKAIQQWNGALPTYMLGGGTVPFIQIPTGG